MNMYVYKYMQAYEQSYIFIYIYTYINERIRTYKLQYTTLNDADNLQVI